MTTERIQVYAILDKVLVYHHPPIPGKDDTPVSPAVITKVYGASIDPLIQIKWPSRKEPDYIRSNQIAEVITKTSKRKLRSEKVKYVTMSMHGYMHFQEERDSKRAKTDNTNNNSNDDEGYNHNNIDKEDNHNNIDEEDNDKNDEEDNDKNDEEENGIIMNEHNDNNNFKRNNLQYQDVINVFGLQLGFRKPDLTDFIFGLELGFEKAPVNPSRFWLWVI